MRPCREWRSAGGSLRSLCARPTGLTEHWAFFLLLDEPAHEDGRSFSSQFRKPFAFVGLVEDKPAQLRDVLNTWMGGPPGLASEVNFVGHQVRGVLRPRLHHTRTGRALNCITRDPFFRRKITWGILLQGGRSGGVDAAEAVGEEGVERDVFLANETVVGGMAVGEQVEDGADAGGSGQLDGAARHPADGAAVDFVGVAFLAWEKKCL